MKLAGLKIQHGSLVSYAQNSSSSRSGLYQLVCETQIRFWGTPGLNKQGPNNVDQYHGCLKDIHITPLIVPASISFRATESSQGGSLIVPLMNLHLSCNFDTFQDVKHLPGISITRVG